MYVDATVKNTSMDNIPHDVWTHVLLEAGRNVTGTIQLMGRGTTGGTKGWVSEVSIDWPQS